MGENVNNPFNDNDVNTNPFEAEELLNSAAFESFLEEVAQCVQKLDEYNTNLEQIKDLQSKIFKMPQQDRRKSMANEIDELNQNNKNLRNEIRLVNTYNRSRYSKIFIILMLLNHTNLCQNSISSTKDFTMARSYEFTIQSFV